MSADNTALTTLRACPLFDDVSFASRLTKMFNDGMLAAAVNSHILVLTHFGCRTLLQSPVKLHHHAAKGRSSVRSLTCGKDCVGCCSFGTVRLLELS